MALIDVPFEQMRTLYNILFIANFLSIFFFVILPEARVLLGILIGMAYILFLLTFDRGVMDDGERRLMYFVEVSAVVDIVLMVLYPQAIIALFIYLVMAAFIYVIVTRKYVIY